MRLSNNPWQELPTKPPFVVPSDLLAVTVFNKHANQRAKIHTNLMPEPFVGQRNAPVVVLLLNPGYADAEEHVHRQKDFRAALRANFTNPSDHFFIKREADEPGAKYFTRATRNLIREFGRDVVSKNILTIEYFPYHSVGFAHANLRLPSQQFSFDLVRDAIDRQAVIILARGKQMWLGAVPELAAHRRLYFGNPRIMSLSAGNLGDQAYCDIKRALQSSDA
jgi:hypothetical protein